MMRPKRIRDEKQYQQYIASPAWKAFRQNVLTERNHVCEGCGDKRHLHVHHWTYDRLGSEQPEDVAVLCRVCHEGMHNRFDTAYKEVRTVVLARVNRLREKRKAEAEEQNRARRQAIIRARVEQWMAEDAAKANPQPKVIVGARRRPKAAEVVVVEVQ